MTQEERELLLKDLCTRLPYGVICNDNRHGSSRVTYIDITPDDIEQKNGKVVVYYFDFDECGELKNCKPYLRPLSSMTEEEKRELMQISEKYLDDWSTTDSNLLKWELDAKVSNKRAVFYNSHHLDWNGLIPMGLALESPEGMYNIK